MHEIRLALAGTIQLARGDAGGLAWFDASIDGFWGSFRAALICYPMFLLLLSLRVTAAQLASSSIARIAVVETIGYAIAWTAFPLVVLPMTSLLGRENRFLLFMVAYNWSQAPQTVLFVIVAILATILPTTFGSVIEIAGAIAVLLYEWFIARVGLLLPGVSATLFVLIDILLGTVVSQVTQSLY